MPCNKTIWYTFNMRKILIINAWIFGIFLVGITGASADQLCSTSDSDTLTKCSGSTPFCAYPDTGLWKKGTGWCQSTKPDYHNKSATTANKPTTQTPCPAGKTLINGKCSDCGETLELPKSTQSPAITPKPSLPETKPNNSLFDLRITCAIQESQKNDYHYLYTAFIQCIKWGDLVTCADILLKNPAIASKCNPQANIFDALWNFVTHRK